MENSSKLSLNGGRVNPLVKLSLLIIMLVGIMIYPSWRFSFILLTIVLLLFPASGVSLNLSCRRMKFMVQAGRIGPM